MTVSRDTADASISAVLTGRFFACGLLLALSACAGGSPTAIFTPAAAPAAAEPAPSAAAAPATTAPAPSVAAATPPPSAAAAAPPAKSSPPEKLSQTEINEKCWMDPAINKIKDLDARLKLVDKCVDQKTKAQGGL